MIYETTILFFNIFLIILFILLSFICIISTIFYIIVYVYPRVGIYLKMYIEDVKRNDLNE